MSIISREGGIGMSARRNYQQTNKGKDKRKSRPNRKKFIVFLAAILIISLGGFAGHRAIFSTEQDNPSPESPELPNPGEITEEAEKEDTRPTSPFTGLPYEEGEIFKRPFALLIDNHPNARPQYGIQDASYVYEVLAEGEVTRLLSIFHHAQNYNYGPIRSLRPYYAHLGRENDAIFAHCGQSEQTAQLLWQDGYDNIDEHSHSQYYTRDSGLSSPHNLFTNLHRLEEGAQELGLYRESEVDPLLEIEERNSQGSIEKIEIPFSAQNHVTYKWDESEEGYRRYVNDRPHNDALYGEQIVVNNVIVQYATHQYISDVHRKFHLTGSGEGVLVQNGHAEEITWEKDSYGQQTTFKLSNGSEVKAHPGKTWIHILSPQKEAIISEKQDDHQ